MRTRVLTGLLLVTLCLSAQAQQTIRIYRVGSSSFGNKLAIQIEELIEASGNYTVEWGASGYTRLDQWATGEASYQAWLDAKMPEIIFGNYDYVIIQTIAWFNINPTSQEYLWTEILPDLNQRVQDAGAEIILYDKYPSPGCYPDYVRSNNLFHIRALIESGIEKIAWGGTSVEELGELQYFKDMLVLYDMGGHPGPMMDYLSACGISYMITGVNPIGTSMTNISMEGFCDSWFQGLATSSDPDLIAFYNDNVDRVVNAHLQLTPWEADTLQRTAMRNHLAWMDTLAANRDNASRYDATLAEIEDIRALHGQWDILYPEGPPPNVVDRCQPLGASALSEDQLAAIRDTTLMWSDRVEQAAQQYLDAGEYDQLRQDYIDYWLDYNSKFRDDTYYMLLVELEKARMDSVPDAAEIARLEQQSIMFREVLSLPAEQMLIDLITTGEADAFTGSFTWPSTPNTTYAPQFGQAQVDLASTWSEVEEVRMMYLDIWQNNDYMDSLRDNSYPLSTWLMVDSIFAASYAAFTPGYRFLDVTASRPVQSLTVSPDQASFVLGSDVEITVATYFGYELKGWTGDASGSANPLTVTMDASKSIVADIGFVDDGIIIDNHEGYPTASALKEINRDNIANSFGPDVYKIKSEPLASMRYTPNLAGREGEYDVYLYYPSGGPTSVVYYVSHDGGIDTLTVDQSTTAQQWYQIGTWSFSNGDYVELDGEASSGRAYADALRLVSTGPVKAAPASPVVTNRPLSCRAVTINGRQALDITGPSGSEATVALFTVSGRMVAQTTATLSSGRALLALPGVARGSLVARVSVRADGVEQSLTRRVLGL